MSDALKEYVGKVRNALRNHLVPRSWYGKLKEIMDDLKATYENKLAIYIDQKVPEIKNIADKKKQEYEEAVGAAKETKSSVKDFQTLAKNMFI